MFLSPLNRTQIVFKLGQIGLFGDLVSILAFRNALLFELSVLIMQSMHATSAPGQAPAKPSPLKPTRFPITILWLQVCPAWLKGHRHLKKGSDEVVRQVAPCPQGCSRSQTSTRSVHVRPTKSLSQKHLKSLGPVEEQEPPFSQGLSSQGDLGDLK